jgi:hypothetical protein
MSENSGYKQFVDRETVYRNRHEIASCGDSTYYWRLSDMLGLPYEVVDNGVLGEQAGYRRLSTQTPQGTLCAYSVPSVYRVSQLTMVATLSRSSQTTTKERRQMKRLADSYYWLERSAGRIWLCWYVRVGAMGQTSVYRTPLGVVHL